MTRRLTGSDRLAIAQDQARRELGVTQRNVSARRKRERTTPVVDPSLADPRSLRSPPTLAIPFEALVSDNRKYGVAGGRMTLTHRYREAKAAVHELAATQWRVRGLGRLAPLSGRVVLVATLYEPNAATDADGRERDPGNYRKLVCDALEGVVYGRDGQIDDERWRRGPVDARAPRLELVVCEAP